MEKRLIIAMALSLMVLLLFQRFTVEKNKGTKSYMAAGSSRSETAVAERSTPQEAGKESRKIKDEVPIPQEEILEIETEKYRILFSDRGGNLKKLTLKKYNEKDTEELLFDSENMERQMFRIKSGLLADINGRKFEVIQGKGYVEYKRKEADWIEITKRYTFHNSFDYIGLEIFIKNLSPRKVVFSYQMNGPSGLEKSEKIAGRSFLEANALIDNKIWRVKKVKGGKEKSGQIVWVALKNRYFVLLLRPFELPKSLLVKQSGRENLITIINSEDYEILPGKTLTNQYLLYAGPLDENKIAALGYDDMNSVVDYGFFGGVSKVLLLILRFFYNAGIKNWGVAIICLTVLINLILFPLTFKSFSSMQKIKKIQPHMQKLKDLHKDNPHKLNKEMMDLYKKYNVNPLGGCLPILLQMPIFIALYQGLMRSLELKGAHFLWIKNLAKPDAVPLPFSLPFIGKEINILPLLMVGMMIVQQKISQGHMGGTMTNEQAQQQKMMMLLMPLLFGFLFYNMPSGLVLYWLTNTILMTSEQNFISRRTAEK